MLEEHTTTSSVSGAPAGSRSRAGTIRGWLAGAGLVLFLMSLLVGGAGFRNDVNQWQDLTKVLAVALFVASMVALAMGMIGDSYRRE